MDKEEMFNNLKELNAAITKAAKMIGITNLSAD